jgi:hypothetical protein
MGPAPLPTLVDFAPFARAPAPKAVLLTRWALANRPTAVWVCAPVVSARQLGLVSRIPVLPELHACDGSDEPASAATANALLASSAM